MITITHKGQITLSKVLLQALGLSVGDKIMVKVVGEKALLEPVGGGILDLIGTMPKIKIPKGKTVDDLLHEARKEHLEKTIC
ncbi:AbrB/MazE/SpoVT family DNA-binding domain-containing protein [Candidatus Gottesmanbacteria bacterium]|nr:AbrB/MazE/SpoVT family DNA-binding domain-containing protein [Candidatus Gottesmanbacteria bacterium]